MKRALLLISAIALLRSGYAALQQHRIEEPHPGQLIYQPANEPLLNPIDSSHDPEDQIRHSTPPHSSNPSHQSPYDSDSLDTPPPFSLGTSGTHWGIVYFPYTDEGTCKSLLSIRSDIASIARKGFRTIRLHSPDCGALQKVGSAARLHNLSIILGIHVDESGDLDLIDQQLEELISWSQKDADNWRLIDLIVIGEELLTSHTFSPPILASVLSTSRVVLREAGYDGPITTTEPLATLLKYASILCPVLDVPASNIHPFFHASVPATLAGPYVSAALHELDTVCNDVENSIVPPGVRGVNLETGWPRSGRPNGLAVPGRVEQMDAIEGIRQAGGGRSVFLGWGDDVWKEEGELGVENAWGVGHLFGGEEESEG